MPEPDEPVRVATQFKPNLEFYTVPYSQIPDTAVLAHFKGHGDFYATPEVLNDPANFNTEIKHPPFPEEVRDMLRRFQRAFAGFHDRTLEEWEDDLRKDDYPWRDIAHTELLADGMERFAAHLTADDKMTKQKRKDVWDALRSTFAQIEESKAIAAGKLEPPRIGTLSSNRVKEIIKWFISANEDDPSRPARVEHLRRLIDPVDRHTPDRVPIASLLNEEGTNINESGEFRVQDFLRADILTGVDVNSGKEFLVYGRDALEPVDDGKGLIAHVEQGIRVRTIEIDMDTDEEGNLVGSDELNTLLTIVEAAKGRHDYTGQIITRQRK